MKKIILITVILLSVFILACTTQVATPPKQVLVKDTEAQKEIPVPTPNPIVAAPPVNPAECKVADNAYANLQATMNNADAIVKSFLAVNSYLDVKIGDCLIFPFAIRNEFLQSKEFVFVSGFESAKANVGGVSNMITADTDTMNTWLSEADLSSKTIAPHEYVIVPLKVKIGAMRGPNDATIPGTYTFAIQAYYKTGTASKIPYEGKYLVSVRVSK